MAGELLLQRRVPSDRRGLMMIEAANWGGLGWPEKSPSEENPSRPGVDWGFRGHTQGALSREGMTKAERSVTNPYCAAKIKETARRTIIASVAR
jgi:hypothetical protein